MQRLHASVFKAVCSVLLLFSFGQLHAQAPAYCPTLTGLPDTFYACKNTRPQLPIAIIGNIQTGTTLLDTFWTVPTGATLTRPDSLVTQAYVDLTSYMYTLTMLSIRANIWKNPYFDDRDTFFYNAGDPDFPTWPNTPDYFPKTNTLPLRPQYYFVTDDPAKANLAYVGPGGTPIPDHTPAGVGTGSGRMMVVNGATTAGKIVYSQTATVIPGETYRLSAYATSVTPLNTAQLQFYVNGVPVVSARSPLYLTPIVPDWQVMQADYKATSSRITVQIVNITTDPDPGNDFALDDITVEPLCVQQDSVYVKAINLQPLISYVDRPGCPEDTVDFSADIKAQPTGAPPATAPNRFFWDFGDGQFSTQQNPRHFYTTPRDTFFIKLYVYRDEVQADGTTITCVDSTNSFYDDRGRLLLFKAAFTQDKDTICRGETVTFTDSSKPVGLYPVKYFFGTGDSTTVRSPQYVFDTGGIFTVLQVATNNEGCKDTARDTVVSIQPVGVSFSMTDTAICQGETVRFNALVDTSYENYLWELGDGRLVQDSTSISNTYILPGTYVIRFSATNDYCPNVDTIRKLEVLETPKITLGRDTTICPTGQPILLQNLSTGNDPRNTYLWNTGDQTEQILARNAGIFFLTGTNIEGCTSADTIVITRNCFLDIPSVFTPNGDGESDYFLPRQLLSKGLQTFKMKIYNRWGQQVFETQQVEGRGWDGKMSGVDQPVGVYLYFIEATLQNGATEKYDGNLTLLR